MKARQGTVLGYNAQAAVDFESDLIVGEALVNAQSDSALMVPMLEEVEQTAGQNADESLFDAGFSSWEQWAVVEEQGVEVLVAIQAQGAKCEYGKDQFLYDESRDEYLCPQERRLPLVSVLQPTTGISGFVGCYRCNPAGCPAQKQCTRSKSGRTVTRSQYERVKERQVEKQKDPDNRELMRLRKQMIERVFGQIKGNDGFRRSLRRSMAGAAAEWALACASVNLRKMYRFWLQGRLKLAG